MGVPLSHTHVTVTEQFADVIQTGSSLQSQRREAVAKVMDPQPFDVGLITGLPEGCPQVQNVPSLRSTP